MELPQALEGCLAHDNETRRRAEEAIRALSHHPQIVPELARWMFQSPSDPIRQLSAVLLRKRVAKHWAALPPEVHHQLKQGLLHQLVHEPQHPVRRNVADVIAAVAKLTTPGNQWPELMSSLLQFSQSPLADHREVALILLAAMADTLGDYIVSQVELIQRVILHGLQDSSSVVRCAALSCQEALLPLVVEEEHIKACRQVLEVLIQAVAHAVPHHDDEFILKSCQLLEDAAECPAPLLPGSSVIQLVELCMVVAGNQGLDRGTREQALQLMQWVGRSKPKQLTKNKALLQQLVGGLCTLCREAPPEDRDDQELPVHKAAAQTLDTLARHLPSQYVFPQVMGSARDALQSPEPHVRAAGLTMMAIIAEGCADVMRRKLEQYLPAVLQCLKDGDKEVRGSAAFAIGQFSEFLQPEVLQQYHALLPALFEVMKDTTQDVQERACYAVETLCEYLDQGDLVPYLPALLEQLMAVLLHGNTAVKEMALSAIASVAAASSAAFQPYAAPLVPALQHFMRMTSGDHMAARCRATECAGLVAQALGKDMPRAVVEELMHLALDGVNKLDSPELREYTHGMFGCVAKALKEDFLLYLPTVLPMALHTCNQEDGLLEVDDGEDDREDDGEASSEEDDDEAAGRQAYRIRTGVLEEKCAAAQAVGMYLEGAPSGCTSNVQEILATMQKLTRYFHEEVRIQAYEVLGKVVIAVKKLWPASAAQGNPESPETLHVLNIAFPLLLKALDEEVDKGGVTAAMNGMSMVLKEVAPSVLAPFLEPLVLGMAKLLKGEALCQTLEEEEEELDGDDEDKAGEEDEELMVAVVDLMPLLADVMSPEHYALLFHQHHAGPLLARMKAPHPETIRGAAMGGLAEAAEKLRHHMAPLLDKAIPLLSRELRTQDPINRQNAAFCVGVLLGGCGSAAAGHLGNVLQALHPLFSKSETPGVRDNALGAVSRIIMALPEVVPLSVVLPVFVSALPLEEDMDEARPVYNAVAFVLAGEGIPVSREMAGLLVRALLQGCCQTNIPMEVRMETAKKLAALRERYPQEVDWALGELTEDQQQGVVQLASS